MNNAIVLISGGLDSVVLAHYLKKIKKIKEIKLVFVDYGQKSLNQELFCVKEASKDLNASLEIINMRWLGKISTSLINKESNNKNIKDEGEIISWYVPCRNTLFLLIGLSIAESNFISKKKKYDIYIGIKYEGELQFKDTTPEFINNMNSITKFCTQKGDFKFIAPFLEKDKEDLIELADKLGVDLSKTYSCYLGDNKKELNHCGICGGCKSRKKAFKFSNMGDPSVYSV